MANRFTHWLGLGITCSAIAVAGCSKSDDMTSSTGSGGGGGGATTQSAGGKKLVIGMVAKSQSNDVFQAAHAGAVDAAKELGEKYGADISIDWQTPVAEDATKQVEAIEALTRDHVDGILVSCSEASTLTPAIDAAVAKGVPVMCFDSDAPNSKRFAFYGTDDVKCGQLLMAALADSMGGKGTVAILAGNQSAPNLQKRTVAAKEELAKHPDMKLLSSSGGVFFHEETPEKAAETVATATNANPEIGGWCMIGGWPLFTTDALKWPAGKIKVASCDALPAQLGYVKDGHVDTLYAQDCYGWGHKGVEVILAKVLDKKDPESVRLVDPLTKVTKDNVDAFGKNWEKWLGTK